MITKIESNYMFSSFTFPLRMRVRPKSMFNKYEIEQLMPRLPWSQRQTLTWLSLTAMNGDEPEPPEKILWMKLPGWADAR